MRSNGIAGLVLAGVVLGTGACKTLDVPNLNRSSVAELTSGTPSRAAVAAATQGLVRHLRTSQNTQTLGILGREGYNLDPSNPQNAAIFFNPGQGIEGNWSSPYAGFLQAKIVISAADKAVGLNAAEVQGIKGFAKTMQAIYLQYVIYSTLLSGAQLDVPDDVTSALTPIVTDTGQVYQRIVALYNEAKTHLQAAGATFPFSPGTGFAGFNTPANFLKFNRAMKTQLEIYRSNWTQALTDLSESFVTPTGPMATGVYSTFSALTGDATNGLYDPTARQRYTHPSIFAQAQKKADGTTLDDRFTTKVRLNPQGTIARYGFTVDHYFVRYNAPDAPVPVMKNEELLLLRAEANLGLDPTDAAGTALADINTVRTTSGGIPALTAVEWNAKSSTQKLDQLLVEKRYSLMWENGTSWLDARHYGRLAQLPKDRPGDVVYPYARIPDTECNARSPQPSGCNRPAGL